MFCRFLGVKILTPLGEIGNKLKLQKLSKIKLTFIRIWVQNITGIRESVCLFIDVASYFIWYSNGWGFSRNAY